MAGSPSTLVSPDAAPCQPLSVASGSVFDRIMCADIARCTNEQCAVRESCMRWIFRLDGHARVFFHGPLETHGCRLFINDGSYSPNKVI